jgi:uncharacterized membrane-anchored protein
MSARSDRGFRRRVLTCAAVLLIAGAGSSAAQTKPDIPWQDGPLTADLGGLATIAVPAGFRFTDAAGTRTALEAMQNPTSGREKGMIVREDPSGQVWFVVFEYNPIGYVKDDEKSSLNHEAILTTIRKSTEAANKLRRQRGWATIDVDGWEKRPFYEPASHNLAWAIRGHSDNGTSINYSTRVLGRGGVMEVDLVLAPEQLAGALPEFASLMNGFDFQQGNRYAEFKRGDKVAAYGLTALVAGGAGAAAVKSGALGKLWKVIVAGFIALLAAVKRLLTKWFGNKGLQTVEQN